MPARSCGTVFDRLMGDNVTVARNSYKSAEQDNRCAQDDLLPLYVNGRLSASQQARIAEHIGICEVCQSSLAQLERLAQAVIQSDVTPMVPPPNVERLQRRIDTYEARRRWGRPLAQAASVVMVGLLVMLAFSGGNQEPTALFETATSDEGGAVYDYVFDVTFDARVGGESPMVALHGMIDAESTELLDATTYRIVIRQPALSVAALQELNGRLTSAERVVVAQLVTVRPYEK